MLVYQRVLHVFPEDSRGSHVPRCSKWGGAGAEALEALTSPPVEKEVGPGLMAWMIEDLLGFAEDDFLFSSWEMPLLGESIGIIFYFSVVP